MLRIKVTHVLLFIAIAAMSCDRHYSADKIHEIPKMDEKFLTTAINHLNNSIEDYPSNPDNYYKKALILMEQGSYGSALLIAKKAHSLNSNDPEYLYLLAHLYSINNKKDETLETALKAVENGASKPKLYSLITEVYLEKGSTQKAMEYIEKAIALNPKDREYYFLKGKIFLNRGDTAAAEKNFLLTVADSEIHKEAYLHLSNIYIAQKDFDKSGKIVQELLKNFPKDTDILFQHGLVLNQLELFDSSKQIFKKVIELDTFHVEALNKLASYFYQKYQYDSANFYAEKSLSIDRKETFPMLIQARILDRSRKYYEAIARYESILAVDSTHKVASDELRYIRNKILYFQRQRDAERQRELEVMPTLEPIF